jgi:hypothetical protein
MRTRTPDIRDLCLGMARKRYGEFSNNIDLTTLPPRVLPELPGPDGRRKKPGSAFR